MSFRQGDLVSGVDAYGRTVTGIASGDGAGGYVTLTPNPRPDGGVWVQPPAVTVAVTSCAVVERSETLQQTKQLQDQANAGQRATWQRETDLREQAGGSRER